MAYISILYRCFFYGQSPRIFMMIEECLELIEILFVLYPDDILMSGKWWKYEKKQDNCSGFSSCADFVWMCMRKQQRQKEWSFVYEDRLLKYGTIVRHNQQRLEIKLVYFLYISFQTENIGLNIIELTSSIFLEHYKVLPRKAGQTE